VNEPTPGTLHDMKEAPMKVTLTEPGIAGSYEVVENRGGARRQAGLRGAVRLRARVDARPGKSAWRCECWPR